jgi:hypothetical protein
MTDATTPKTPAAKPDDRALKIPEPMVPPLATQGGKDMQVSAEPGPQSAPPGPTAAPEPEKDPGINANVVS